MVFHGCLDRFLARAGDACCYEKNGWWNGGTAMKESQVYPATFGRADAGL